MFYVENVHLQINEMIHLQNKTDWVNLENMKLIFLFIRPLSSLYQFS